ncbi:MAG: FliH/SctL family protein [Bacillus subtilis]|nr:FliH/SctL family protein [Bacillus subtilis]
MFFKSVRKDVKGDRRRGYRRIDDRNLISRAHEEAYAIKEKAAKEGFEYGVEAAKRELARFNESLSAFLNAKEKALENVSGDIAFIAIKVAEKIIKTEVACDETIVLNIVSQTLKEIGKDESSIIIKVHPFETEIVKENMPKLFPYGSVHTKITVISDETIDQGSCIVETNNGMVDAKFSTQLQILKKAFEAGL